MAGTSQKSSHGVPMPLRAAGAAVLAGCVLLLLSGCYERTVAHEGLLSNREGDTYQPNSSNKPIPVVDSVLGTTPTPKKDKYGLKKK